jgi:hypothetical protein
MFLNSIDDFHSLHQKRKMIQSDLSMISFAYFFLSQFDYCFHAGNLVEFENCTYGKVSERMNCKQWQICPIDCNGI